MRRNRKNMECERYKYSSRCSKFPKVLRLSKRLKIMLEAQNSQEC